MATALFYRAATPFARALEGLGYPGPLRVLLGVRAFGLDLVFRAGPLRVWPRTELMGRVTFIFEYLLPELPLHAVRAALDARTGRDATSRAIVELVRLAPMHVPAFREEDLALVDVGILLGACVRGNLTRIYL